MHAGLLSVVILSLIHLYANKTRVLGWLWHGRFLSFAAGISFAYVFVDLLPALEKGQPVLKRAFDAFVPYFDHHAYFIALLGLLFYYGIQRRVESSRTEKFWLDISGYLLFNFFIGASLSDSSNPEIQPLWLFTIALGMHDFIQDHQARTRNSKLYMGPGRLWLVVALFLGYLVGLATHIPDAVVAMAVSFLAGGIILNVLHYELPEKKGSSYYPFVIGALSFTIILMVL